MHLILMALGKKDSPKFLDIGLIKLPYDIFSLDFDKISKIDGWGNLYSQ